MRRDIGEQRREQLLIAATAKIAEAGRQNHGIDLDRIARALMCVEQSKCDRSLSSDLDGVDGSVGAQVNCRTSVQALLIHQEVKLMDDVVIGCAVIAAAEIRGHRALVRLGHGMKVIDEVRKVRVLREGASVFEMVAEPALDVIDVGGGN